MRVTVWRLGRTTLGAVCLVLGVIGLFLPFLQGILFLAVGLSLLGAESEWARQYRKRLLQWIRRGKKREDHGNG